MRRALFAVAALAAGCSLDAAGTAEPAAVIDDASVDAAADITVERDTAAPIEEDVAVDSFIAETAPVIDTAPEVLDSGCPAAKGGAKLCEGIAHREELAIGQVLDGRADDFCDVQYVDFDNSKGMVRDPATTPGPATTTMRIRAAWSSWGLHAHVAVKDPNVLPHTPDSDPNLFYGDSVELYVAGHDSLTGAFDGTTRDLGAHQLVFSAPTATIASRATYFYGGTSRGSPPSSLWSARTTSAGYELELRIPWADLKAVSPATGKRIALSWGLNNKYDATKPQAFSVFEVRPLTTATVCPGGGDGQPFCDDRLWCTPALL